MKRKEFERWLRGHGARFDRHGASHDIWKRGSAKTSIPRHGEIRPGTGKAICAQLGIPHPF